MRVFYVQPDEVRREVKNGNGTTGPYTFSFSVQSEDSVAVELFTNQEGVPSSVLTSGVDFTVVLAAPPGVGGDIFLTEALPVGQQIVITSEEPYTQDTVYVENDPFPAKVTENALDKLTVLTQQNRDDVNDRGVLQSAQSTLGRPVTLDLPVAGQGLRWADTLDRLENVDLIGIGTIAVPVPVSQGGTNATTAAGARGPANLNVLEDVLTTKGDIVVRGASAEERLAIGAEGTVPTVVGGDLVYQAPPLPRGAIDGFICANAVGDPANDLTVNPGQLTRSNGAGLTLATALTKQLDATWAEGNDAGGLFSGAVAPATDLTYHVFVIRKDSDGTVDIGFDSSVTGANAPAGWTVERLIQSFRLQVAGGAVWPTFKQVGDTVWLSSLTDQATLPTGISNTLTAPSTHALNGVPTGLELRLSGSAAVRVSTSGGRYFGVFSHFLTNVGNVDNCQLMQRDGNPQNNGGTASSWEAVCDASAQIKLYGDSGLTDQRVTVLAYTHPRGQDGV